MWSLTQFLCQSSPTYVTSRSAVSLRTPKTVISSCLKGLTHCRMYHRWSIQEPIVMFRTSAATVTQLSETKQIDQQGRTACQLDPARHQEVTDMLSESDGINGAHWPPHNPWSWHENCRNIQNHTQCEALADTWPQTIPRLQKGNWNITHVAQLLCNCESQWILIR